MKTFKEEQAKNLKTLEQYVPVVDKVHGGNHPEFHEVRRIFDQMIDKVNTNEEADLKLDKEFEELRGVTNNYTIPSDTCETYEAVYKILSDLDNDYNKNIKE